MASEVDGDVADVQVSGGVALMDQARPLPIALSGWITQERAFAWHTAPWFWRCKFIACSSPPLVNLVPWPQARRLIMSEWVFFARFHVLWRMRACSALSCCGWCVMRVAWAKKPGLLAKWSMLGRNRPCCRMLLMLPRGPV